MALPAGLPNGGEGRSESGAVGGLNGRQVSGVAGGAAMKMAGRVAVRMDFRDGRGLKNDNGCEQQEEQRGLVKTRSPSRWSGDTCHQME